MDENWQRWIKTNRERGCSVESMIDAMVSAGMERAIATQAVAEPISTSPVKEQVGAYQYEPSTVGEGNLTVACERNVEILMQCRKPEIVVFGNVLSPQECEEVITRAKSHMAPSTVTDEKDGSNHTHQDRTSEGCFFQRCADEFISELDYRIAELMQLPVEHGEGLQILRYGIGAQYKPHFDYFPPNHVGSKTHISVKGQRVSTMVIYLNDVPAGGETIFPNVGISVKAKRGSAVYFKYCNSLGQLDHFTLHGGAPVVEGEKWAMTKWMRQNPH
jgi:prolyl 4-hydroxylase